MLSTDTCNNFLFFIFEVNEEKGKSGTEFKDGRFHPPNSRTYPSPPLIFLNKDKHLAADIWGHDKEFKWENRVSS